MNFIGLDYHKKYTFATKINKESGEVFKRKLGNTKASFRDFIDPTERNRAVLETTRSWPVAYNLAKDLCEEVKLAHPYKTRAIAEARIKTDSIDSETLAYLLSCDLICESYLRDEENRNYQKTLRHRLFLVCQRTRLSNPETAGGNPQGSLYGGHGPD